MQNDEIREIVKIVEQWQKERRYGQIILNFCNGTCAHVNLHESKKLRSAAKPSCEKVVSF